jgi:hypothetical protein
MEGPLSTETQRAAVGEAMKDIDALQLSDLQNIGKQRPSEKKKEKAAQKVLNGYITLSMLQLQERETMSMFSAMHRLGSIESRPQWLPIHRGEGKYKKTIGAVLVRTTLKEDTTRFFSIGDPPR